MIRRLWRFAALSLLVLCSPASAFTISPMSLKFSPVAETQTIKVMNPSDKQVEMTLRVYSWSDSHDLSALEETFDIIAMPPIFQVPPNSEQTVRIAVRKPLEIEREQAYRVLIGEVPSEVAPEQAIGLNLTVSLPIFVRPDGAEAVPVWTLAKRSAKESQLVLKNEGNSYLKITKISIAPESDAMAPLFESGGGYVLSGDSRTWLIDRDLSGLKDPIVVKAESNIGPIEAKIKFSDS